VPKALVPANPVTDIFATPVAVKLSTAPVADTPVSLTFASAEMLNDPSALVPATPVSVTLATPVTVNSFRS
jgi:hypothetical protein